MYISIWFTVYITIQPLNDYWAAVWKYFSTWFPFYLFVKIANIFHCLVYIKNHIKKVLDGFLSGLLYISMLYFVADICGKISLIGHMDIRPLNNYLAAG